MNMCIRCEIKKAKCKNMCLTCYYATRNGNKIRSELMKERNYITDKEAVVTDKKGTCWTLDKEDFNIVKDYLWQDSGFGYAQREGRKNENIFKVYLHKLICPNFKIVDHIDRNTHNCHKNNLREGSKINAVNRCYKIGLSGFRGVQISKNRNRNIWIASLVRNKKRISLGRFVHKQDAINAIKLHILLSKENICNDQYKL